MMSGDQRQALSERHDDQEPEYQLEQQSSIEQNFSLEKANSEESSSKILYPARVYDSAYVLRMSSLNRQSLNNAASTKEQNPQKAQSVKKIESLNYAATSQFGVIDLQPYQRFKEHNQCVAFSMVTYSNTVHGTATLNIKCLVKDFEELDPVIIPFRQFDDRHTTGLLTSQAQVASQRFGNNHFVEVQFDPMDEGCIIYLFVGFQENVFELIPVTYMPIINTTPVTRQLKEFTAYQLNTDCNRIFPITFVDETNKINIVNLKQPTIEIQKDTMFVFDINPEIVNPEMFLDYDMGFEFVGIENLLTHYYNSLLKKNFGQLFDFTGDQIVNQEKIKHYFKVDKDIVSSNLNFVGLVNNLKLYILYFDQYEEKIAFIQTIFQLTKKLFDQRYVDEDALHRITQIQEIDDAKQISYVQFMNQSKSEIDYGQCLQVNREVTAYVSNPDGPTYVVYLDTHNIIWRIEKYKYHAVFPVRPTDGGMRVSIVNNRLSTRFVADAVRIQSRKHLAQLGISLASKRHQCSVGVMVYGARMEATFQMDKGRYVVYFTNLKKIFDAEISNTYYASVDDRMFLLSDGYRQLHLRVDDFDDMVVLIYLLGAMQGAEFRE
ncbi:Hypothetical_protein [Hexamita inflata]|uniref:Hypothetical_protein n=1 Tax=Hexamita inflata TaxID=28002 RepID=A0AA86R8L3_9EUKA|nr:Hypothetical protein HINF_LOCUS60380 [Hexamita inflata]